MASPSSSAGRSHSTVVHARRRELAPLPLLVRCHASASPNPHPLEQGRCVLGAGADADVIVDSDTVSRRHASLRLVPEGVEVTDLDSKNGLYYLGQRFRSMVIPAGGRFHLGSVEVELLVDTRAFSATSGEEPNRYGDLIGASAPMRELFARLVRLEGSKVNVLVTGPSGTGKELVARALHERSLANRGPLVVVNCAALDRHLVKSELFGHERGAFTGALERRLGAFEAARGGTLFLDEVGELPAEVQPVLLRALESRKITRLGSSKEIEVDARFVCATHRDLSEEVAAGRFRADLLYRIDVVRIEVPALAARRQDVPLLANAFARAQGASTLPEDFLQALSSHDWPGNVRELRNAVEAYLAIGALPRESTPAPGSFAAALDSFVDTGQSYAAQKDELLARFTRAYFERLLEETSGNQSEAARRSGMQRTYLTKLLGKLGLRRG